MKFLFSDLWIKLVSIFIAFSLWWFVHGEKQGQRNIDLDVELSNVPPSLILAREFDPQISLRLLGPKTRLSRMNPDHFGTYKLDLKDARKGMNSFWIHAEDFRLPIGVEIRRIVPQLFRVELDQKEEKMVPVQTRFVDSLEAGFELETVEISPEKINVVGPERLIRAIRKAQLEPIALSGRRESFEQRVKLEYLSELLKYSVGEVNVSVNIKENVLEKIFKEIKVRNLELLDDTVRPHEPFSVNVFVSGKAGDVNDLRPEEVIVRVDPPKDPLQNKLALRASILKNVREVSIRLEPQFLVLNN